jgi:hypothetical protein
MSARGRRDDDLEGLKHRLAANAEQLAVALFGEPSSRTSRELRFGKHGSVKVDTAGPKRGRFSNFEAGTGGSMLDAFVDAYNCDFASAIEHARAWLGDERTMPAPPKKKRQPVVDVDAKERHNAETAAKLFAAARPVAGTPAEKYLRGRAITPSAWPDATVRWHAGITFAGVPLTLHEPLRAAAGVVVFAVRDAGEQVVAVQRVFLDRDGAPLKDSGKKIKLTLGARHGRAVVFPGDAAGPLLLAEGPETAASAWYATGCETWSTIGAINGVNLDAVPRERMVVVCRDDDARNAPSRKGLRDAIRRWRAEGRRIVEALPWELTRGDKSDFNDALQAQGPAYVRERIAAALHRAEHRPPEDREPPTCAPHWEAPQHDRTEALARMRAEVVALLDAVERRAAAERAYQAAQAALETELATMPAAETPRAKRAGLKRIRSEIATQFGADWQAPGPRLQVNVAAGAGKTQLIADEIARRGAALGFVWVLVPTVAEAARVGAMIPGAEVVRGRSAPTPAAGPDDDTRTCLRHVIAEQVAQAGFNVQRSLCQHGAVTCGRFGDCEYQAQRARLALLKARGHGVVVAAHEALAVNMALPPPDLVVVDERAWDKLVRTVELAPDRLADGAMTNWQGKGLDAALDYRRIAGAVRASFEADPRHILRELRARGLTLPADIKPALKYLRELDRDAESGLTPDMDDADIGERLAIQAGGDDAPTLRHLFKALAAELEIERDQAHAVEFLPNARRKVDGIVETVARVRVHTLREIVPGEHAAVLLLDASADLAINRRLFGDTLREVDARIERRAEVVQVRGKSFSRTSLIGTNKSGAREVGRDGKASAARLRGDVLAIARSLHGGGERVFLALPKPVEEILDPELPADVATAHFGALRGKNEFADCSVAVVVGRDEPPAHAVEDMARALWATDPTPLDLPGAYRRGQRGRRMRDGSGEAEHVSLHPDPRAQAVLEQFREREVEQAVDRLRLVHNATPKRVYLLLALPLDVTVDRSTTWRGLVAELAARLDNGQAGKGRRLGIDRLAEAVRRTGVMPLGAAELVRLHPGLWASVRRAEADLNTPSPQIDLLFGKTGYLISVAYRRPGQRGRPCRALLPAGADWPARLTAAVGPVVAAWHEEPPEPAATPPPAPEPAPAVPGVPHCEAVERPSRPLYEPGANLAAGPPPAEVPPEAAQAAAQAPEPAVEAPPPEAVPAPPPCWPGGRLGNAERAWALEQIRCAGVSQDAVARAAGVSRPQLTNALHGRFGLSPPAAARVLAALAALPVRQPGLLPL